MKPRVLLRELIWTLLLISGASAAARTVVLSSLPGCGNASSPLLVGSLFGCTVNGSIMPGDSITWTWTVSSGGAANFSMHTSVRALQSTVTLGIVGSAANPVQPGVFSSYSSSVFDYVSGKLAFYIPTSDVARPLVCLMQAHFLFGMPGCELLARLVYNFTCSVRRMHAEKNMSIWLLSQEAVCVLHHRHGWIRAACIRFILKLQYANLCALTA